MKNENGSPTAQESQAKRAVDDTGDEATRAEEQGDASEPDAPTSEQENEGMSTILDADPLFGVQRDAGEE